MEIINIPIKEIKPYKNNPRNNKVAIEPTANSIEKFGFRVPIIVDKNYEIVAGHTRYEAAKMLGLENVPCIIDDDPSPEKIKAFRLADNKVAELAGWDFELLEAELEEINIDMSIFGFDVPEDMMENDFSEVNSEICLDDFSDEQFEYQCPECGFMFNA